MTKANTLKDQLEKEVEKLEKEEGAKGKLDEVNILLKKLKNEEIAYPQQMLASQIAYLYYMVSGADQLPGNEAHKRYDELVSQLKVIEQEIEKVLK